MQSRRLQAVFIWCLFFGKTPAWTMQQMYGEIQHRRQWEECWRIKRAMMSSFYFMHDFRVFRSGTLLQHKVAASAASTQQKDPPAKVSSLLLEHLL